MEILGSKELMEQVRSKGLCTTCGACVDICPYHQSHKGRIALTFDCDIAQGQCFAVCPQTEFDANELSELMFQVPFQNLPLGHYRSVKSAKATDKIIKGNFQNGGTVSALMMFALEEKWIDSAVLTGSKELVPEPVMADSSEDIAKCGTTKYMATPTLSLVNKSAREGRKKLGVVGTGCQMKASASIRSNPMNKDEYKDAIALSLGLFCTWSLDTREFLDYLKSRVGREQVISMDVPPPPAEIFVIKTENGELELPLSEIREMTQEACATCPDMTAEWADVSVGAFEGKPGWNTVIIRSQKGEEWVNAAVEAGYLVLDDLPDESLDHLIQGAGNKKKRADNAKHEEVQ